VLYFIFNSINIHHNCVKVYVYVWANRKMLCVENCFSDIEKFTMTHVNDLKAPSSS